jgi:hypothetical protein
MLRRTELTLLLVTLDWISEPDLRRSTGQELNKGQARNSLARAVFIHRLGEIRDRTYENQQHRCSGLNLLVTAIILWNTRYLEHAVTALRETEADQLLAHLSPLGWEHINLTGDYVWNTRSACRKETVSNLGACPAMGEAADRGERTEGGLSRVATAYRLCSPPRSETVSSVKRPSRTWGC